MLAELAAANAAFSIIKKCVQNGAEIATAGKAISDFTNAKDTIDNKARKDSSKNKQANSDLESFLARDQIKAKEDELRSMMNLFGRPNMYNDYIRFCAEDYNTSNLNNNFAHLANNSIGKYSKNIV